MTHVWVEKSIDYVVQGLGLLAMSLFKSTEFVKF